MAKSALPPSQTTAIAALITSEPSRRRGDLPARLSRVEFTRFGHPDVAGFWALLVWSNSCDGWAQTPPLRLLYPRHALPPPRGPGSREVLWSSPPGTVQTYCLEHLATSTKIPSPAPSEVSLPVSGRLDRSIVAGVVKWGAVPGTRAPEKRDRAMDDKVTLLSRPLTRRSLLRGSLTVLAGSAAFVGRPAAVPAQAASPVARQLGWFAHAQIAGDFTAIGKGYFKEVGLDVNIVPRGPPTDPVALLPTRSVLIEHVAS